MTTRLLSKMSVITVSIKHGPSQVTVEVPADCTVAAFQELVEQATGVFVCKQKLIFKGKVLDPGKSLAEQQVGQGSKLLLLAGESGGVPTKVRLFARLPGQRLRVLHGSLCTSRAKWQPRCPRLRKQQRHSRSLSRPSLQPRVCLCCPHNQASLPHGRSVSSSCSCCFFNPARHQGP